MTANLTEVYNWVLYDFRCLPLLAIVERIVHNTCKYFIERYAKAADAMADSRLVYSAKCTTYMNDKIKKAGFHIVRRTGTVQHRYEVLCMERFCHGVNTQPVIQECQIEPNGVCHCSCMKPLLLHRPCSHVIASCSLMNMTVGSFVSHHYLKESVMSTWNGEVYGYGIVGTFTENRDSDYRWGPDVRRLRVKAGRRKTSRIRNDMDESEAGRRQRRCSICNENGHTYKKCPTRGTGGVGPSCAAPDAAQPPTTN